MTKMLLFHLNGFLAKIGLSDQSARFKDKTWEKKILFRIHILVLNTESKLRLTDTVFENHRKSLIQHCERSELRLHFEWTKVNYKFWRVFENLKLAVKQCYQTGQFL